jgi:hypothetical protein
MTPTDYEKAVLERFRTLFPPPRFEVRHNIKLPGEKSRKPRQIDGGVFETGKPRPILIFDAKRQSRVVDVGKAGLTIALVQDVGGTPAVMVATSRFSAAATNHLAAEGIEILTITIEEAQGLRWIPLLEAGFLVDRGFREISGHLVEAARNGNAKPFLQTTVPYEEWLAVAALSHSKFPGSVGKVLTVLARDHLDDGVRFNAIQLLRTHPGSLDS